MSLVILGLVAFFASLSQNRTVYSSIYSDQTTLCTNSYLPGLPDRSNERARMGWAW